VRDRASSRRGRAPFTSRAGRAGGRRIQARFLSADRRARATGSRTRSPHGRTLRRCLRPRDYKRTRWGREVEPTRPTSQRSPEASREKDRPPARSTRPGRRGAALPRPETLATAANHRRIRGQGWHLLTVRSAPHGGTAPRVAARTARARRVRDRPTLKHQPWTSSSFQPDG
jgi:hypothetical protein